MKLILNKILFELWRASGIVGATLLALWLVSCGGAGGSDNSSSDSGEVYIGITDAPGDFSTYTVDVTSISLTKASGAVVETLPVNTRIDFAEYVEMTEFFTAQSIPAGVYVEGSMTIDYSDADIWVEDESGNAVKVDNLVDASGNPVTSLIMDVTLEDRNRLIVAPGIPASLTLDFDLNASHDTVFESGVPTTTVEPILIADVELEKDKSYRIRGPLLSVDVAENSYQIAVHPFRRVFDANDHRFGRLNVNVNDDTVYEIDGASYSGDSGLNEMNNLPAATATIAFGELRRNPRRFIATEVYAGSSVPGGELDVVRGHVIARNGDVLTIKGATLIRSDIRAEFNDEVEVTLADSTIVKKQLSVDDYAIDDISVGQKITAFGTVTNSDVDALALDASAGTVRMLLTRNNGVVVDDSGNELVVNLSRIGHRHPDIFDFTGTGTSADNDADPTNYAYDTDALNVASFNVDSAVKARGFATPFGSAPKDFEVHTLIDVATLPAVLVSSWDPASATAFSALSESGLVVDTSGAGRFHHISQGGVRIDLTELAASVTVLPKDSDNGVFTIRSTSSYEVHNDFGNFVAALQNWLDGGATVQRIIAPGTFDNGAGELAARRIHILLGDS